MSVDQPMGPDFPELNAARSVTAVSGVQAKHQGFATTRRKKVPFGLHPELHVQMAEGAVSPLDVPVVLPDDFDFACRHMVTMGQDFDHWQRKQLRILGASTGKLAALESFFISRRTDAAKAACVSVQPHVLDAASRIMNWPGVALPIVGYGRGSNRW